METLGLVLISFAGIFIIFIGLIVAWKILRGEIDMTKVISEEGSDKASLSRFQMLVWTFIVGLSFLYLVILNDAIPDIPNAVLSLLGISGGTYLLSKGIQKMK